MKKDGISKSPVVSKTSADQEQVSDKKLRFSEMRYRRLFESARDGILILDAKTAEIDDVNPYLIELLGYTREEILNKKMWEISSFKDTKINKQVFAELQKTKYVRYDDLPLETKDGLKISVEFVSNVYDCDGTDIIQCNIRDNSKRNLSEIALKVTTRALKILSESNQALLGSETEQNLLDEYCRIAVQSGGYQLAWIGYVNSSTGKTIVPMAHFGSMPGSLSQNHLVLHEDEIKNGPFGRAIKTMDVQVCDDITSISHMTIKKNEAIKHGFHSLVVLPFKLSKDTKACFSLFGATRHFWSSPEKELLQELSADLAFGIKALRTALDKAEQQEKLRNSLEQTIQVLAETIGQRDSYTAGHQRRVAVLCSRIGLELGLSEDRIHGLHLAATIHDLGKIGVPTEILVKPTRLSAMEFGLIKDHVTIGVSILKNVEFPWPIASIIGQHHERLNGTGYPKGLAGEKTLLESRILAVADVVEAMASHRPYRPALGIEAALQEIETYRNILFDPHVVDTCLTIFRDKEFSFTD